MRARLAVLLLVPLLAACDGATPGNGPVKFGIVSGNRQTATAGDKQLGEPVVGKVVRTPGGIAYHWVTPAYAEGTVVNGSPVENAVVCSVKVSEAALEPFSPCTNSRKDGTVTFFFAPGTKAGRALSEIRGDVDGKPVVFDTVEAIIKPGPAVRHNFEGKGWGSQSTPAAFPLSPGPGAPPYVADVHNNPIEYALVPRALAHQAGSTGEAARTIIATGVGCAPVDAIVADTVVWTGVMHAVAGGAITLSFPYADQLSNPRWSDRECFFGRP